MFRSQEGREKQMETLAAAIENMVAKSEHSVQEIENLATGEKGDPEHDLFINAANVIRVAEPLKRMPSELRAGNVTPLKDTPQVMFRSYSAPPRTPERFAETTEDLRNRAGTAANRIHQFLITLHAAKDAARNMANAAYAKHLEEPHIFENLAECLVDYGNDMWDVATILQDAEAGHFGRAETNLL